jgi:hypothetical protein
MCGINIFIGQETNNVIYILKFTKAILKETKKEIIFEEKVNKFLMQTGWRT